MCTLPSAMIASEETSILATSALRLAAAGLGLDAAALLLAVTVAVA
jgi:hypothetical protein